MRLILLFLIGLIAFPVSSFALVKVSPLMMSRDMRTILVGQSQIPPDTLTGTNMIRETYLHDVSLFVKQYIWYPIQTILLTPTIDLSLSYRLAIQDYSLSCEIAALRILLDRFDIRVTESEIFARIPQYPYVYSGGIWGDPDREFVGYYTGGQTRQTGYGVYERPLADYVDTLDLHTEIINMADHTGTLTPQTHITRLLGLLDKKDTHIMLWWDWCTSSDVEDGILPRGWSHILRFFPLPARNSCLRTAIARTLIWTTPAWRIVTGISWEHAFVLLGYIGTKENPTHIIVWDTYTGRHVYPTREWMRKWWLLQYRSLIITR